ncbi:UNVERIFIED_CONTAM: hypothetical protein GTU68_026114, partial [Idotea baltica]|nr:hypothetical protein [Idotea baltica]
MRLSVKTFSQTVYFHPRLNKLHNRYLSHIAMSSAKPKVLVTRSDIPQKALDTLKEKCEVDIYPEPFPIPRDELLKR